MMPLTNDGELMVVWEKCLLYCSLALGFFSATVARAHSYYPRLIE